MQELNPSKSTQDAVATAQKHARCAYRGPTGRQCRNVLTASADNIFCPIHISRIDRAQKDDRQSVVNELFGDVKDLNTSFTIQRFLQKLMPMIVQRRLTRGEAYLLSYISSLLLQSLETAKRELYVATDYDDVALDQAIRKSLQPFLVETLGYDPIPAVNRQIAGRKDALREHHANLAARPRVVDRVPRDFRDRAPDQRDLSSFSENTRVTVDPANPHAS
jgi:hypothetical protein